MPTLCVWYLVKESFTKTYFHSSSNLIVHLFQNRSTFIVLIISQRTSHGHIPLHYSFYFKKICPNHLIIKLVNPFIFNCIIFSTCVYTTMIFSHHILPFMLLYSLLPSNKWHTGCFFIKSRGINFSKTFS